jgi:AcrR family transcriptional regulator
MTLSRKEREQRFRTELVLDVAEGVFAERGFRTASVEEIASRAELSVGSLYNLFPSKEELFAAVVERRQEAFLSEVRQAVGGEASPLAKLERLGAFTLTHFEQYETVFRLYLSATNGFLWNIRPRLGERSFQKHLEMLQFIAGICREGMTKEGWPQSDPESLALVITGMLNAFLTRWVTTDSGSAIGTRVREVQVLIRRVVGAPAGNPRAASRPAGRR